MLLNREKRSSIPSSVPWLVTPFKFFNPIGGVTGAIEITCTYPTEYTKTIMQLNPEINKLGMIGAIKKTFNERGLFGFYRGYGALLLFSVPKN